MEEERLRRELDRKIEVERRRHQYREATLEELRWQTAREDMAALRAELEKERAEQARRVKRERQMEIDALTALEMVRRTLERERRDGHYDKPDEHIPPGYPSWPPRPPGPVPDGRRDPRDRPPPSDPPGPPGPPPNGGDDNPPPDSPGLPPAPPEEEDDDNNDVPMPDVPTPVPGPPPGNGDLPMPDVPTPIPYPSWKGLDILPKAWIEWLDYYRENEWAIKNKYRPTLVIPVPSYSGKGGGGGTNYAPVQGGGYADNYEDWYYNIYLKRKDAYQWPTRFG